MHGSSVVCGVMFGPKFVFSIHSYSVVYNVMFGPKFVSSIHSDARFLGIV